MMVSYSQGECALLSSLFFTFGLLIYGLVFLKKIQYYNIRTVKSFLYFEKAYLV